MDEKKRKEVERDLEKHKMKVVEYEMMYKPLIF